MSLNSLLQDLAPLAAIHAELLQLKTDVESVNQVADQLIEEVNAFSGNHHDLLALMTGRIEELNTNLKAILEIEITGAPFADFEAPECPQPEGGGSEG